MKHKEKCECAICKEGVIAINEKHREAMEKYGWYAHYVPDDHEYPYGVNYHTHGLMESFDHLDFQICLAVSMETAHHIVSIAIEKIKEGFKYEHGKKYGELIGAADGVSEYKVLMLEAEECERKVLRMIFPDKNGKFDNELVYQKQGCIDSMILHD